jgi:hypothetical protein
MEINRAVFTSDSLLRDGTRFTAGALVHGLLQASGGTPLNWGHDLGKTVGWALPTHISIGRTVSLLRGVTLLPSNIRDAEWLAQRKDQYLRQLHTAQLAPHLTALRHALGAEFATRAKYAFLDGAAAVSPNLARALFPEVFEKADKNGLVPLDELIKDRVRPGIYKRGALAVVAHPYFRRGLSRHNNLNWDLLGGLEEEPLSQGTKRVLLDPDMVVLATSVLDPIEHEYWFGPGFDDNLGGIPPGVTRHVADELEASFTGVKSMDFFWYSRDDKHTFEAEELKDESDTGLHEDEFACRYVHSIVDEATGVIEHLDGAVRVYDFAAMVERVEQKLDAVPRKSTYTKLWRIDGSLALDGWKRMIYHHFRGHSLVREYFNVPSPEEHIDKAEESLAPNETVSPFDVRFLFRFDAAAIRGSTDGVVDEPHVPSLEWDEFELAFQQGGAPPLCRTFEADALAGDSFADEGLQALLKTEQDERLRFSVTASLVAPEAPYTLVVDGVRDDIRRLLPHISALLGSSALDELASRMTDLVRTYRESS